MKYTCNKFYKIKGVIRIVLIIKWSFFLDETTYFLGTVITVSCTMKLSPDKIMFHTARHRYGLDNQL